MDVRKKLAEIVKKAAYSSLPSNTEDFHLNMFVTNLLSHGVTVQEWISVDDRLPKNSDNVLVCHNNGLVTTNAWLGANWWFKNERNQITHWMPLPEPPEAALKGGEG